MKYIRRIRLQAAVLLLTLTLFFSGCGGSSLLFRELTAQEVQSWTTGDAPVQSEETLGLSAMRQIAQSGGPVSYTHLW